MTSAAGPKSKGWYGLKAVTGLFLPRTAVLRLAFLAAILFSVAIFSPFSVILDYITCGLIILMIFIRISRSHLVRTCATYICVAVAFLFVSFLVPLADGGKGFGIGSHPYSGVVGCVELLLLFAAAWLLMGVPQQAFRIKLDGNGDGYAQRVLVGAIATVACAFTATYLFLLHFGGGPLATVNSGPLVTGIFLTAVLLWPIYRSLARACWQRGVTGVFGRAAWKKPWSETVSEVHAALDQQGKTKMAPSATALKSGGQVQDTSAAPDSLSPRNAESSKVVTGFHECVEEAEPDNPSRS
jgi:hypothetical protein